MEKGEEGRSLIQLKSPEFGSDLGHKSHHYGSILFPFLLSSDFLYVGHSQLGSSFCMEIKLQELYS